MGFVPVFHFKEDAFPRLSTNLNLELIPTHLDLFQHPPQLEHPLFTRVEHPPEVQTVVVGWKFKLTVLPRQV